MSVALPIDVDDAVLPAAPVLGVVCVQDFGFGHRTARCSCGWAGKRRYVKAAAEQDAWMHSIHERCTVAVPLVRPAFAF